MAWFECKYSAGGGTNFADLMALAADGTSSSPVIFDLTDAEIHTLATKVPQYMFYYNRNVGDISLANITDVGAFAFFNGRNVKSINLPVCTSVGESAFEAIHQDASTALTSINLPLCTSIGAAAFRNIRTNTSSSNKLVVDIHSVTSLGQNAFRSTTSGMNWNIEEIDISNVVTVGAYAFAGGQNTLGTLKIGSACTSIAANILNGTTCTNLVVDRATPPALTTTLGTAPAHIYVPDDAVNTYKAASVWSNYASIIEGISNYNP